MKHCCLALVAATWCGLPVLAGEVKPTDTLGPAPTMAVLHRIDTAKGLAEHLVTIVRLVPQSRSEKINVDGRFEFVTRTIAVPVMEVQVRQLNLRESKFFLPSGKNVPLGEALNKLKAGHTVVLSTDGRMIHPNFARVLREDVFIIVAPLMPEAAPPVPTPAPDKSR